jgi:PAS domain S-box-containing protein
MPCYLSVQDHDLKVIDANLRFEQDFGDYRGRACYQVYKQRSEKCEDCPVERTFRDGQTHRSHQQVRTLDGRTVEVIVDTTPIRDESGQVVSVMEMSTDVTDLKNLQLQLRESQERYRTLFEEVPCYISIQDRDLNLVEANRRFRDDFGNGLGCKCYSIYKHRQEACIPCSVQETFEDGQVHHSEEVVTNQRGERRNVLVYSAPIHNDEGGIQSVMEMSADITPIRQLQSQLEGIGLLISSISHGIKGLLTGLDGGMYLVNSGLSKNNTQRVEQGWEMVQRNIDRIRSTVMNILYYAKERVPQIEQVSALELAREAAALVQARANEHQVAFDLDLPEDAGTFEADPRALRSLLVNLLENSIDACRVDKKKANHRIHLALRIGPERVEFEISDNGIGMDQETREKAFSLFFSSKGVEGTGLGLFIANKIATKHGGQIELDSELDRGTRFVVRIPRRAASWPTTQ